MSISMLRLNLQRQMKGVGQGTELYVVCRLQPDKMLSRAIDRLKRLAFSCTPPAVYIYTTGEGTNSPAGCILLPI